jgi:hypothetical protein
MELDEDRGYCVLPIDLIWNWALCHGHVVLVLLEAPDKAPHIVFQRYPSLLRVR